MKWNRNAKPTQIKANDRGTKTENAKNFKPTEKCPKLARKRTKVAQFSLKSHSSNRPQML